MTHFVGRGYLPGVVTASVVLCMCTHRVGCPPASTISAAESPRVNPGGEVPKQAGPGGWLWGMYPLALLFLFDVLMVFFSQGFVH